MRAAIHSLIRTAIRPGFGLGIAVFFFSLCTWACDSVDLRQKHDFGLPRNQGSLGWCYAYALSDLLGFELGERVSPFDLATGLYITQPAYGLDKKERLSQLAGGRIDWTFNAAKERGVCLEKRVSASGLSSARSLIEYEQLAASLSTLKSKLEISRFCHQNAFRLHQIFPTSSLAELQEAVENSADAQKPFIALADQICQPRRPIGNLSLAALKFSANADAVRYIKSVLKSGRPAAIVYSSKTLRDTQYSGDADHASTVVGMRKTNTGTCQFLLRNSWGSVNTRPYAPELKSNYQGGYVWVDESVMTRMIGSVYSLSRK